MYKKSYKGFVVGLIVFLVLLLSISFIPAEDEHLPMRLIMLLTSWYMAALSFHVWRTEQIYWYNGTTYEEAVAAGSERRKEFAKKHLDRFAICAAATLLYSSAAQALGWPFWIDLVLATVALIAAAISTVKIKL